MAEGAVDNGGQVDEALQGHRVPGRLHRRHGAIVGERLLRWRLLLLALVLVLWCGLLLLLLWLSRGNRLRRLRGGGRLRGHDDDAMGTKYGYVCLYG